ncbi:hypothetical protein ACFSHS_00840 [Blastococcus deserti]|uniref:Uncharacterized protein n=1 Tax=Blastococcus deserti TaxID=2259033 RepID=A0ABW4X693_9ACTN
MGKHTAVEGASADPIVAGALLHRGARPGGDHAADGARAAGESGLGWPGPPAREGGGLGWPGDARERAADTTVAPAALVRRGWRRILGLGRAA